MKTTIPVILLVIAVLLVGIVARLSIGSSVHVHESVALQPGGIVSEFIPANNHVEGYISGEAPFSVYVAPPDPKHFGDFDLEHSVVSWVNVTEVLLDFNTTEGVYLVVVNGNSSQTVWINFRASHR